MKKYILDVHNIMHKDPQLKAAMGRSLYIAARAFIQLLVPFVSRYKAYKIIAVFDGDASNIDTPYQNISIISPGAGKTADEVIKSLVKVLRTPAETTVVSSDTELHNFARIYSAKTMPAEQFLAMISGRSENLSPKSSTVKSGREKPGGVSKKEVNRMKKAFEDDDDLDIPEHFLGKR